MMIGPILAVFVISIVLVIGCSTPSQKQTQKSSQEQEQSQKAEQSQRSDQGQATGSTVPIIIICNQMNAGPANGAACIQPSNSTGIPDTLRIIGAKPESKPKAK